jgi:hypothetical protein
MWRESGKTYPQDSWEKIIEECKEIEELDDPCEPECDTVQIHKYCEAAALFGQMVRMPSSDELPKDASPLPPSPPRTGEEAFELALSAAGHRVNLCWPEITNVAERLMEVGYLTGEEVEDIVFGSTTLEEERS